MSIEKAKIDASGMGDLKTMAEAFVPALDDVADHRNEYGDKHGANLARELANVWMEIIHLADEEESKVKKTHGYLDKNHAV